MRPEKGTINEARCLRLIRRAIDALGLDLGGACVLTEAATGFYQLTPLIAALAGADPVYAVTRDSRHGRAEVVAEQTLALAGRWDVADAVNVLTSREDSRIGSADIVTNLGFVRPMDAAFLRRLKPTVVIPLMFETWEYRPADLDVQECGRRGIPVAGTDEHAPELAIMKYVGQLAVKLLMELDVEVFRSRVALVGSGEFGAAAHEALAAAGAEVTPVDLLAADASGAGETSDAIRQADALVVAEHRSRELLIGPAGGVSASKLAGLNPGMVMAHIAGAVDAAEIEAAGIPHRPERLAPGGYMSVATDYLGPRPVVDLHTAGLKVGQALAQAVAEGRRGADAEQRAAEICRWAQPLTRELLKAKP